MFPRIRWVSNEYALFECSLNGGKFTRCGSGLQGSWSRSEISTGSHEFRVRGRDTKGNVGEIITTTIEIGKRSRKVISNISRYYHQYYLHLTYFHKNRPCGTINVT